MQPSILPKCSRAVLTVGLLITSGFLSSCSTTSNTDDNVKAALAGDEDNYRTTEESLSQSLEVPPNLISPISKQSDLTKVLHPASQQHTDIPVRKFNDVQVKTNLSERWIEVPVHSVKEVDKVWKDIQSFVISLGFEVDQVDPSLGVVRTKYKARTELAPIDVQGPLTRLLNSWRPELAEGVYDRLTARVESDIKQGKMRLYFYDHVLYRNTDGDTDQWQARPYSPEIEAEALYQAMVFLGVNRNEAFKQIQVTQHLVLPEMAEKGEQKILDGVLLKAPLDVAWTYTKAMIYRAGWSLEKMDNAKHILLVKPPKHLTESKEGLLDRLFKQDSQPRLPETLRLTLQTVAGKPHQQWLTASETEDTEARLTPRQQAVIFKALGLLNQ